MSGVSNATWHNCSLRPAPMNSAPPDRADAAREVPGKPLPPATDVESTHAWVRLAIALTLSTLGGVGMWSAVVALPAVQSEFHIARADASLPYTLTMLGFCFGSIAMGKLSDRFGIRVPVIAGSVALALGYVAAGYAANLWQFTLAQGLLIGVGSAATFAPLLAHISLWFSRRRGIAVAIFASGNYLAGTVWPPLVQHFIQEMGWRHTYFAVAALCIATMIPLGMLLRRAPPIVDSNARGHTAMPARLAALGLSAGALQTLLIIAGVACCVAMAMPQVHLVAYCSDLGYGPARGAQMLSVMLACGIVSRLVFGWICDRIGGLRTLLLGSSLQFVALVLFLPFDGLISLYVISALFGLLQGGIVPSYAIIVREFFAPKEAGARVGAVITATLFGMALGGWMSGAIFDLTGSYRAAFANGITWNLVNVSIALFLLRRAMARPVFA
jgi:MFS family permease